MSFSEFPKTFYRYNEQGEKEGKTFNAIEDVEAGWLTFEDFAALPAPAVKRPKAADGQGAVDAGKRLVAAEAEVARLKDSAKLLEDEGKLKDARLVAKAARVDELEAFIRAVDDDQCPPALKAAIASLFAPVEPAKEPEAKPRRKPAA